MLLSIIATSAIAITLSLGLFPQAALAQAPDPLEVAAAAQVSADIGWRDLGAVGI